LPGHQRPQHPKAETPCRRPHDRKRDTTWESFIGHTKDGATGATTTPQRGIEKNRRTVDRIELRFVHEKDARGLASELEAGLCFARECVSNLRSLDGEGVLGSLCVLHTYLEYLNTMAGELYKVIPAGGDAL
jgi:hypothetical protein